ASSQSRAPSAPAPAALPAPSPPSAPPPRSTHGTRARGRAEAAPLTAVMARILSARRSARLHYVPSRVPTSKESPHGMSARDPHPRFSPPPPAAAPRRAR